MNAISFYKNAKQEILNLGFSDEIDWQAAQTPLQINESEFLQEAAWVVYCSGFREATVRQHFNFISLCFCDWASAEEIVAKREGCIAAAMRVIGNRRKHEAVGNIAVRVAEDGFENYKKTLIEAPIDTLRELPFMGPVTALHLAKNLGFNVAKPDRHLLRLHAQLGFDDVGAMCQAIALASGDPIGVVDLVLWRYLERKGAGAIHHH